LERDFGAKADVVGADDAAYFLFDEEPLGT